MHNQQRVSGTPTTESLIEHQLYDYGTHHKQSIDFEPPKLEIIDVQTGKHIVKEKENKNAVCFPVSCSILLKI